MSPGVHTLELASFFFEAGVLLESPRSAPLQVTVAAGIGAPAGDPTDAPAPEDPSPDPGEDRRLGSAVVVEQLNDIADMGVDPEGRLLVGERAGVVRLVDLAGQGVRTSLVLEDTLASGGPGMLLSLALDPDFERTRLLYVLKTAPRREGLTYQIVRYRGVAGIFGERAVLLETGRADPAQPSGTIRVGRDGKLYAAVVQAPIREDRGEMRGLVLRLNPDGTTPSDQRSGDPVYVAADRELRGFDWHPDTQELWLARDGGGAPARLLSVGRDRGQSIAGLVDGDYSLNESGRVSALGFYGAGLLPSLQGTLLVVGQGGLESVRFDPQDASRVVSIERLLDMPLRAMAVDAHGTLFVATSDAILRATAQ
jgi:glucose/arabinose dehydrogenase